MIPPGSRYEDSERQFTQSHVYNEYGFPFLEGTSPNLKIQVASREALYRLAVQGTGGRGFGVSLQEYYVKDTEDMQWLSFKFLRDANVWWQFAEANPQVWYPLDMKTGDYVVIPQGLSET